MRELLCIAGFALAAVSTTATAETATGFRAGARVEGQVFIREQAGDIHYYLAPSAAGPRPLLVVLQGSGCESLFARGSDGALAATAGQDIVQQMANGRYAVMVVEKPDVVPEGPAHSGGTTDACSASFNHSHALDPWVGTLSTAINAALRNSGVDRRAGVRVLGLSEGSIVSARLARSRPDVNHVVFISGFGCNQWRDELVVARRNAANPEAARAAVANVETGLRAIAADPNATDKQFDGQSYLFWSTFGRACPAEDLLASHAQVFMAYGTADEEVDSSGDEAITAGFLSAGRPIHVHRVIGGSHVLDTPGTEPFANLLGVFGEALDWMEH